MNLMDILNLLIQKLIIQTKTNETKTNETKTNETKTNEIKTNEIKTNETKNVKTTDVSTSYNSYEARKEVLEASRATYVAMLSKDGLTVSDIIAINDKIEKIDIELKEIYLQIDTYDGLIDYSTVTVNYYEKGEYKDPSFMEEYGNYVGEFLPTPIKYFSFLRPLNELQIAMAFSKFEKLYYTYYQLL